MAAPSSKSDDKNSVPGEPSSSITPATSADTEERCVNPQHEARRAVILEQLAPFVDPETGLLPVKRGMSRVPERRANQLAGLRPWQPGHTGNRGGRPKGPTFAEDARAILDGGVPAVIRDLVAKGTGLPLKEVDKLSLRQAVILNLMVDYFKRGKLDQLATVIDRTDPKSRRVEHGGAIGHLHALAKSVVHMNEAEAADLYASLREGGTVELGPEDVVVDPD